MYAGYILSFEQTFLARNHAPLAVVALAAVAAVEVVLHPQL